MSVILLIIILKMITIMKKMVTVSELKEMLHEGNVCFSYYKKNGELKSTIGTLNNVALDRIGYMFSEDSKHTKSELNVVCYYDVNSNGWRSFSTKINENVVAEAI